MEKVIVHPRVMERHPELDEQDVLDAWDACIRAVPRLETDAVEYIALGVDGRGRLIEMVVRETVTGTWVIYHAFTPPTAKALRELGMTRR